MTDSIDTSEREAEEPRGPFNLPIRDMREEPVPNQPADPLRVALQLALEATPEELPAALDVLRAHLGMPVAFDHTKTVCYAAPEDLVDDGHSHSFYVHQSPPANREDWVALRVNDSTALTKEQP